MTRVASVVFYAVGSRLTAEVEESCRRLGMVIVAAIRNIDGDHYLLDPAPLRELSDIDGELLRHPFVVPLFTPAHRRKAAAEAQARGFTTAASVVDPTAIVASSAVLGAGSYINAGAVIGAAARFGDFAIVNRAASIGHHVEAGNFVSVGPGATVAGLVKLGDGVMLGAGAVVLPEVAIGAGSIIAAGAVVTRNVAAGGVAVGNPAAVIRQVEAEDGGA